MGMSKYTILLTGIIYVYIYTDTQVLLKTPNTISMDKIQTQKILMHTWGKRNGEDKCKN